jgi:hypothetical protein
LSTKEDNNCNKVDKRHDDFFPWFGQDLPPRCGDLLWSKVALNTSDPKIKLECHNYLPYILIPFVWNLHKESLTSYTK